MTAQCCFQLNVSIVKAIVPDLNLFLFQYQIIWENMLDHLNLSVIAGLFAIAGAGMRPVFGAEIGGISRQLKDSKAQNSAVMEEVLTVPESEKPSQELAQPKLGEQLVDQGDEQRGGRGSSQKNCLMEPDALDCCSHQHDKPEGVNLKFLQVEQEIMSIEEQESSTADSSATSTSTIILMGMAGDPILVTKVSLNTTLVADLQAEWAKQNPEKSDVSTLVVISSDEEAITAPVKRVRELFSAQKLEEALAHNHELVLHAALQLHSMRELRLFYRREFLFSECARKFLTVANDGFRDHRKPLGRVYHQKLRLEHIYRGRAMDPMAVLAWNAQNEALEAARQALLRWHSERKEFETRFHLYDFAIADDESPMTLETLLELRGAMKRLESKSCLDCAALLQVLNDAVQEGQKIVSSKDVKRKLKASQP
ncbi:unnamed protein product [Amoebophrya sp. A25]|nr:unnamed protein product [Amoebophrya sp. A25]|eukprot:GSA25T00012282001.1